MTTTAVSPTSTNSKQPEQFLNPMERVAAWLFLAQAIGWLLLLLRWVTFATFDWQPLGLEQALADMGGSGLAYPLYIISMAINATLGVLLLRQHPLGRRLGIGWAIVGIVLTAVYFTLTREFYSACVLLAVSGLLLVLLGRQTGWALNYPAAFWLIVFFVLPMFIVLIVSLGERTRLGTVAYPALTLNLGVYFDDYGRFFQPINGEYLYLRIFRRSLSLATGNTIICLLVGYPFAYWIVRQPAQYRSLLIFLVMIPFWTNFLVRTYAWMLILRDSGLINNFWTITLHDLAVPLAESNAFFAWLAGVTSNELPLLFNQGAVFLGLFYGYLPFVILPIYSNMEKLDWSLLEAASDLGANNWKRTTRVLLPLTMPGTVAAAIIVFIPSLGAYVTPDLLGGGKVALLGNLLQQQFMTVRDWPFGSAIGFIMMAMMLLAIMLYFRVGGREQ